MMSNTIHPTAVIDKSARIGQDNYIGPYCVIGPNTVIGNGNRLEAFCSIGLPPEHKDYWDGKFGGVIIGSRNIIREFVTVNSGTTRDTIVGDDCVLLRGCYVAHDVHVHNKVTLSCDVSIAGEAVVFEGANLGINACVHQYCAIGHYAMVGMGTVVTKKQKIKPFNTYVGNPARLLKKNQIAIDRNKISQDMMTQMEAEYTGWIAKHKK